MGLIPVKFTVCPPGYDSENKKVHTIDHCLNSCSNKCLPKLYLETLFNTIKDDHHKDDYVSVTALQGCIRKTYLERTTEYGIRPGDRNYDSLRGSLVHEVLSRSKNKNRIIEQDIYYDFDNGRLYGRIDCFDKKTGELTDFKTTKDLGLDYLLKEGKSKVDHIKQANIYKFLLKHGTFVDKRYKKNYDVKSIKINYICMKAAVETGSTIKMKKRGVIQEYKLDDIKLVDDDVIIDYVEPRLKILYDAFNKQILPPIPDKETQGWLCGTKYKDLDGYCEVRYHCPFWIEEAKKRGIPHTYEELDKSISKNTLK